MGTTLISHRFPGGDCQRLKMKGILVISFILIASVCDVLGRMKCTGNPRRYRGKPCASTTRYHDGYQGACGCGSGSGAGRGYPWNINGYTLALNEARFGASWCGRACGRCVKVTTTGGHVPWMGRPTREGQVKYFMITNLCPANGNEQWCKGNTNTYGYEAHFDFADGARQISSLGWDNSEVTYEYVDCATAHAGDPKTPGPRQWRQCECSYEGSSNSTNHIHH